MSQTREQKLEKYNKFFSGKLVAFRYYDEHLANDVYPVSVIEQVTCFKYLGKMVYAIHVYIVEYNSRSLETFLDWEIQNTIKTGVFPERAFSKFL
jgi:hypothetical protein